jgi:PmbA protein
MTSSSTLPTTDLLQLAADAVRQATRSGASAAESVISMADDFSVDVRLGQVETLSESGSRSIGLRVFVGHRVASTSSSDLSPDSIASMVRSALDLCRITSEDPCAGLPDDSAFGAIPGDLALAFEDVNSLPGPDRIEWARRAEAAALAVDPRIKNSEGANFHARTGRRVLVNSRGFSTDTLRSYCSLYAAPIAQDADGRMQRDYWFTSARSLRLLESPEAVGREAARRTLRRLGARRVPTQRASIVFSKEIARSLLGHLFEAANGDSVYRGASFLADKLGQKIAGENIDVIDDGTLVFEQDGLRYGGFGTSPCDAEGLPTRRTVVIQNGVLTSYLLNTYTARKLGLHSTANAARALAGNPGIGAGNFFLQPGTQTPRQIIDTIQKGLYVTETMGFGVNLVTGDYSLGAAGLWIENGTFTHAVEEVTIAGNLGQMFHNIAAIGNDLVFRGATACPTLHIEGMTIAGA